MRKWINAIGLGKKESKELSYDESATIANLIAKRETDDEQVSAWLMSLRSNKQSDDEIMAFVDVFRQHCIQIQSYATSIISAGPNGGRQYCPISIPVSLLMAAVQVPQILLAGSSRSPQEVSSVKNIIESLGVNTHMEVAQWEQVLSAVHINILLTEQICPPLSFIRSILEKPNHGLMFNTVEKILNPIQSANMIIAVDDRTSMQRFVSILPRSGFETSYIVQGIDGSEDLPIYKRSAIRKVTAYGDESSTIDPSTFGFNSDPLKKVDKKQQISIIQKIISGDDSLDIRNEREHVIFNTGMRLVWFDKVSSYEEGFYLARSLLQRKEALRTLNKWSELSQ